MDCYYSDLLILTENPKNFTYLENVEFGQSSQIIHTYIPHRDQILLLTEDDWDMDCYVDNLAIEKNLDPNIEAVRALQTYQPFEGLIWGPVVFEFFSPNHRQTTEKIVELWKDMSSLVIIDE